MKQIKLAFILLTIMIVLGNCTFKNRTTTTKMCLEDLDINVQDTLRNLPVDSFGCHPDLIDLTGHYKLIIYWGLIKLPIATYNIYSKSEVNNYKHFYVFIIKINKVKDLFLFT